MMKLHLKGFIDGLDVECQIKIGSEYIECKLLEVGIGHSLKWK